MQKDSPAFANKLVVRVQMNSFREETQRLWCRTSDYNEGEPDRTILKYCHTVFIHLYVILSYTCWWPTEEMLPDIITGTQCTVISWCGQSVSCYIKVRYGVKFSSDSSRLPDKSPLWEERLPCKSGLIHKLLQIFLHWMLYITSATSHKEVQLALHHYAWLPQEQEAK